MTDKQNMVITQLGMLSLQLGRYLNQFARKDDDLTEDKLGFIKNLVSEMSKTSEALE